MKENSQSPIPNSKTKAFSLIPKFPLSALPFNVGRWTLDVGCSRRSRAFTLIELLTVIGIIALLAGLLFPALNSARRAAKEGKARVQINQLATAFRSYYNEYALWPTNPTPASVTSTVIWLGILQGKDTTNNPKNIVFMEFKSTESSYNNVAGIYDPWNQNYNFDFDTNYDNTVDVPPSPSVAGGNTNTSFIIWSTGDPKKPNTLGSWK